MGDRMGLLLDFTVSVSVWLLWYELKGFYWTIAYNGLSYRYIVCLYWWMQTPSVMVTTGLCKCWFSPGLFSDWPTPFLCPWSTLPWSHPRFNHDNNTTTCVSTQQVSLFLTFLVCFLSFFISFFISFFLSFFLSFFVPFWLSQYLFLLKDFLRTSSKPITVLSVYFYLLSEWHYNQSGIELGEKNPEFFFFFFFYIFMEVLIWFLVPKAPNK